VSEDDGQSVNREDVVLRCKTDCVPVLQPSCTVPACAFGDGREENIGYSSWRCGVLLLPPSSDCLPSSVLHYMLDTSSCSPCSYMDLREVSQRLSCTRRNIMTRDKFSCQ
jgi:hypothetical protein